MSNTPMCTIYRCSDCGTPIPEGIRDLLGSRCASCFQYWINLPPSPACSAAQNRQIELGNAPFQTRDPSRFEDMLAR